MRSPPFFHVRDPSGTSVTLLTADGSLAGHTLYDAYGGVLSSTIPATLTNALTELPEADTGLVHLGGGRYYDPSLGRPLQPNSAGGLPGVPQSLNRYAASAVGQPGVAQAAANSIHPATPHIASFATTLTLEMIARSTVGFLGRESTTVRYTGRSIIAIQASTPSLNANRAAIEAAGGVFEGSLENTQRLVANGTRLSKFRFRTDLFSFEVALDEAETLAAKLGLTEGLVQKGPWRALASVDRPIFETAVGRTARFSWLSKYRVGFATDAFLGGLFQHLEDSQNPYFTSKQRGARITIASFGSGAAGLAGSYIGGSLACGPYAPLCIAGGGLVFGIAWGFGIQPMIFENVPGLQPPPRNLQPFP